VKSGFRIALFCAAWLLPSAPQTLAQNCPPDDGSLSPGEPTTVTGTIRDHNGLRGWIGLQLSHPVCGQKELELTFIKNDTSAKYRETTALDGCKASVTGRLEHSPTAYYATDMFIEDGNIKPDAGCHPAHIQPDLSKAPIPSELRTYKVTVTLNFADGSMPMSGAASSTDSRTNELTPWQAYVEPELNGGQDLLWVSCRDGFHLNDAFTQIEGKQAKPENWLNKQTPGLSAPDKPGLSSITITCVKSTK